jgi:hypothetical protein
MDQRFVIWVSLDDGGDVRVVGVHDNDRLESIELDLARVPEFVIERIALMKLTDVNKTQKGELIGRKLSDNVITIYLTYDEYQQIKEECK